MKRYDLYCKDDFGSRMEPIAQEDIAGDYVRYEDAQAEIARLRGALEQITQLSDDEEGLEHKIARLALECKDAQERA